jgi:tetratricopeptide (TPR) repeat protein
MFCSLALVVAALATAVFAAETSSGEAKSSATPFSGEKVQKTGGKGPLAAPQSDIPPNPGADLSVSASASPTENALQGSSDTSKLSEPLNDSEKNKAVASTGSLALARMFRRDREWGKAIPPYESYLSENPNAPDRALVLLELGRTYAQTGAHEAALSRFYLVLDSAVNQGGGSFMEAREVAYSAQYEIAQTQMALGRHAQAARLFRGMLQLPLADEDRARVYLFGARALNLAGDKPGAADEYRALLQTFPASEVGSEARFEFVVLLAELGRRDEALVEVLALFESDKRSGASEESWRYWQKRAGNKLANMFYDAGNLPESAELYSKLLPLSADPGWRWPLLYQIGLVAEQLKNFGRAREVYVELASAKAEKLPTEISELPRLARWRIEHLDWVKETESELKSLKSGS